MGGRGFLSVSVLKVLSGDGFLCDRARSIRGFFGQFHAVGHYGQSEANEDINSKELEPGAGRARLGSTEGPRVRAVRELWHVRWPWPCKFAYVYSRGHGGQVRSTYPACGMLPSSRSRPAFRNCDGRIARNLSGCNGA